MRRVCVFSGSNIGVRPEYREAARELGRLMAARGIGLVYGGASIGLMGAIADAALEAGGEVIGVIPRSLFKQEVAHAGLSDLYETGSMHERKARMAELSDGFIALPGGFGTFDELFEIVTWSQIGIHNKPIGVLNVADYFAPLFALVAHASREGFIRPVHTEILLREAEPLRLLERLEQYSPPGYSDKWTELPPERQPD